ncbi:MAG: 50S ribosomal protein L22 [Bdellovibrionales bacterium RIFOXYC1_FULL_54_43]|nr:MAG: 50S ribosomal protein L22 [Bdellovibrionales bacterium RIFOXYC1_FULL_54_43]OFZ80331.1 MAG: 50S ribosomal protein L22 [Bdellovibrionales bacterium RIFOXYD1_FULL_55_31]
MEVTAKLSSIRITPRKMGLLADEVRGKAINDALTYLKFSPRKRTADILYRLLKSAAANADQKGTVDVDTLFVKTILVGGGTILKRFRPRAKGSAFRINKRTSHVSVTLAER